MFDLVNDVEAYPKRFGWCDGSEVLEREDNVLVARLDLKFAGLRQSFTTRNTTDKPHSLAMKFVEGPFRSLDGVFTFQALGDVGCKIALALDFDYAGPEGQVVLALVVPSGTTAWQAIELARGGLPAGVTPDPARLGIFARKVA